VSTILMTGASRGIGLHAARKMLDERPDLRLIVVVRGEHLLLSQLPFTGAARIVLTTSDSHFGRSRRTFGMVPPPQWSTPERLARPGTISNGLTAYATSKLGVIYLVHAFARRTALETYSFNPAFTPGTDLLRDDRVGNAFFRFVGPRLPRVNTLEQAGAQLAGVANGPRPAEPGAYIDRWDVT
jgi:NAD(P)-dependent dehydrogenase (short-subunit alcohol dehydrogenase family)